jgi:hypothetical protein
MVEKIQQGNLFQVLKDVIFRQDDGCDFCCIERTISEMFMFQTDEEEGDEFTRHKAFVRTLWRHESPGCGTFGNDELLEFYKRNYERVAPLYTRLIPIAHEYINDPQTQAFITGENDSDSERNDDESEDDTMVGYRRDEVNSIWRDDRAVRFLKTRDFAGLRDYHQNEAEERAERARRSRVMWMPPHAIFAIVLRGVLGDD